MSIVFPARLILFSTSNLTSGRLGELQRMIRSVDEFRLSNPMVKVKLFLLLQCFSESQLVDICDGDNSWITIVKLTNQVSLSKARNLLLSNEVNNLRINDHDLIAFPDDDCWYPSGALDFICKQFSENTALDFLFCRYSSNPEAASNCKFSKASLQQVISHSTSNTMFFRGDVARGNGLFHEGLGIGTKNNGGEDTDYSIRAYYNSREVWYLNIPIIGHRDPEAEFKIRYYSGSLKAISLHSFRSAGGFFAMVRKVFVGLCWIVTGRLSALKYIKALINIFR